MVTDLNKKYLKSLSSSINNSNVFKKKGIRHYSTINKNEIKVFYCVEEDKEEILNYVNGKAGIYMWVNNISGKRYIGSSINLKRRIVEYFNKNRLSSKKGYTMKINRAILKYGYNNFSLIIFEFCQKNLSILHKLEKSYIDKYSPEYNILKTPGMPGQPAGFKLSESTKEKLRKKMLEKLNQEGYLEKLSLAQKNTIPVIVTDIINNTVTEFHSIKGAARKLALDHRYILNYIFLNQTKPIKDRYTVALKLNPDTLKNISERSILLQKSSKKIIVLDLDTNIVEEFLSIGQAARKLGLRQSNISEYLKNLHKRKMPFKNRYVIFFSPNEKKITKYIIWIKLFSIIRTSANVYPG